MQCFLSELPRVLLRSRHLLILIQSAAPYCRAALALVQWLLPPRLFHHQVALAAGRLCEFHSSHLSGRLTASKCGNENTGSHHLTPPLAAPPCAVHPQWLGVRKRSILLLFSSYPSSFFPTFLFHVCLPLTLSLSLSQIGRAHV